MYRTETSVSVAEIVHSPKPLPNTKSIKSYPFHIAKTTDGKLKDRNYILSGISDRSDEIDTIVYPQVQPDVEIDQFWERYCRRVQNTQEAYAFG